MGNFLAYFLPDDDVAILQQLTKRKEYNPNRQCSNEQTVDFDKDLLQICEEYEKQAKLKRQQWQEYYPNRQCSNGQSVYFDKGVQVYAEPERQAFLKPQQRDTYYPNRQCSYEQSLYFKKDVQVYAEPERQALLKPQQRQEYYLNRHRSNEQSVYFEKDLQQVYTEGEREAKLKRPQIEQPREFIAKLPLQSQTPKQLLEVLSQPGITKYVIRRHPTLIKHMLSAVWVESEFLSHLATTSSPYQLIKLTDNSPEFINIKRSFTSTNKKCFNVREIHLIINPYLLMQYELMKERYRQMYGRVTQLPLFHGTSKANIDNICKYNFDWRLKGRARGHKFGQGVSFTPISNYATHYGDKTYDKIMFVADVLVSNTCLGNKLSVLPYGNCDTTTNESKQVYVKYEDNTFYPVYIIYYEGFDYSKQKKGNSVFLQH